MSLRGISLLRSARRVTTIRGIGGSLRTSTAASAIGATRSHTTRDRYFLKPLKETEPEPHYEYGYLNEPATVEILSYAFSGGQPRAGVDKGPGALIEAGLPAQLEKLGWYVEHNSTLEAEIAELTNKTEEEDKAIGKLRKPVSVSAVNERLADDVARVAGEGKLPLTLGGDHSLAMGTVAGTKSVYPDAAVIWVDAHADINTPITTDSGNLHGCPISFLLGLEGTDIPPFNVWLQPCLRPEDLVYIGLRDIDAGEKHILKSLGIKVFTMHDVDRHGIGKVVDMALAHVGAARPIHLSFDVDALDPTVAPSTGTPVRGGLTFREGHYICEAIAETGNLVAVDVMEVNPTLADEVSAEQTIAVGCSLARAALGETLL